MTTSTDPRGRLAELYSAKQTALATAAVSPDQTFVRRHFYDLQLQPQSEPQDDEIMGGGFSNSIDARPAAPDIERGSVRAVYPLDMVQVGYLLGEFFGTVSPTGSGPYVHTFDSASVAIPSTTVERKLNTGAFDGAVGLVARSITFPIGADRGYTRLNVEYFARQCLEQYASTVAGTPTAPALGARVPRAVGSIKRDGSVLGAIISGDVTLTNVLGEDAYHGSALVEDVQLEGRTAALNLTGRFKGSALRDMGKIASGAYLPGVYEIELAWALSASLSLVLTLRNQRFAKVGLATSGPGRLDVGLRGRGEVGASAAMVTAVLTTSQSAAY